MNFKKQAKQLEHFLNEEFKKELPIAILPDKSVVYKNYKIKKDHEGNWTLKYVNTGDFIETFRTKTCALLASKFYDKNDLVKYNSVRMLDTKYWSSSTDTVFFKEKLQRTKDFEKKDLFFCRFDIANARAKYYKDEISRMFKTHF